MEAFIASGHSSCGWLSKRAEGGHDTLLSYERGGRECATLLTSPFASVTFTVRVRVCAVVGLPTERRHVHAGKGGQIHPDIQSQQELEFS